MSQELFTLAIVAAAVIVIVSLCLMARSERNAHIGRRLIDAAGSIESAEREIEHVRMGRELNDRLRDKETDALMRRGFRAMARDNVVHLQFKNRGQPVHFEPKGAA